MSSNPISEVNESNQVNIEFCIKQCKQTIAKPGDGLDNDCDGKIDEERRDGRDNDRDGRVDEDLRKVCFKHNR